MHFEAARLRKLACSDSFQRGRHNHPTGTVADLLLFVKLFIDSAEAQLKRGGLQLVFTISGAVK